MRRLHLVHSGVWGAKPTESIDRNRYFVTFVDDYSMYRSVYVFKRGADVLDKFKLFETLAVNDSCHTLP